MRHSWTVTASSFAALAFVAFAAQASDGRWVRAGDLSGDGIAESVWCDVTLDGAVDGADVGVVLQTLGTRLYAPTAIDPGTCATGTYAVQALGESLCVEVIATSTLAAEIMIGIGQAGPIDPTHIIHPLPNECGEKIAACLTDSRVVTAAGLVKTRCWPTGTPVRAMVGALMATEITRMVQHSALLVACLSVFSRCGPGRTLK